MKKRILIFIVLTILLVLSGCGKPADLSDSAYEIGLAALESIDEYLNKEIDYDTLASRLSNNLRYLKSDKCDGRADQSISTYITITSHNALMKETGNGTIAEIEESRNNLAKVLGK